MGRPPNVSREKVVAIIEKYIDYFKTNTFPEFSHEIWKIISNDFDGRWKARTAYNHIREDKRGDLTKARRNKGIMTPPPSKAVLFEECDPLIEEEATDMKDDESWLPEDCNGDDVVDGKVFDLLLTREDWEKIKPDEKSTESSETLRKGVWPRIIYNAFQKEYHLPCPFMGKWSHVCSNFVPTVSNYFLKFFAYCGDLQECKNVMVGVALTGPSNEGLRLQITTRDTRGKHHVNLKRPINSDERDEVGRELEKESAAMYRERLLRDEMNFGQQVPPHVRELYTYRQVKMEWRKKQLGIDPKKKLNEIQKIQEMTATPQYCNIIHQVGAVEFFVRYITPEQILVMQEYRRVMKEKAAVAIDASGRFVRKFPIIGNKLTGHILLYTITINFEGSTICVAQMLTTIQTQGHIEEWLKSLIPLRFPNPGEVCSDYERAIPMSACLAYNNMSLKAYIDQCFQWAQLEEEKKKTSRPAKTLILIDVAHLMAMIARWPCLTSHSHPCTKPFFMRCAALMIDCKSIQMFQRLFSLICAVALHTSQESAIPALKLTVEEAIDELVEHIADRSSIVKDLETSVQKFEVKKGKDASNYTDEDVLSSSAEGKEITLTHGWIKKLIAKVKPSNDTADVGRAGNIYYCPDLVPQLERIGKEFPLWSQAAIPRREKHASSAFQEGYYTHLRQRVFNHIHTPCSVSQFLHTHLQSIQSGTNLMSANIKDFVHQNAKIPMSASAKRKIDEINEKSDVFPEEPPLKKVFIPDDSDLKSSEKWGGLQNRRIFLDVSSSDEERQDVNLSPTNVQNSEDGEVKNFNKSEDSRNARTSAHASSSFDNVKEQEPSSFSSNINFNLKNRNKWRKVRITDLYSDDEDASSLIDHKSSHTKNPVNSSADFLEELRRKNDMTKNVEDLKNNNPTTISAILENDTSTSAANEQNGKDEKIHHSSKSPKIPEHYIGKPLWNSTPLLDHSYCMPTGNDTETCMEDIPVVDNPNMAHNQKKDDGENTERGQQHESVVGSNSDAGTIVGSMEISADSSKDLLMEFQKKMRKEKTTKVKRPTHFDPYTEMKILNKRKAVNKKGFLLMNGSNRRPEKNGKEKVLVKNTCGFDAISHILEFSAIDNPTYYSFIENSPNAMCQFLTNFITKGAVHDIYTERFNILRQFYRIRRDTNATSLQASYLDAEDSIATIWKHLFSTEPSAIRTKQCSNSQCSRQTITISNLVINHRILSQKGFEALRQALQFNNRIDNITCRTAGCRGLVTETTEPNIHLFIELDVRTRQNQSEGKSCMLKNFPKSLDLGRKYRLAGVIGYVPGHFTAYCLRNKGTWLECDDLSGKIKSCPERTELVPHAVIYIVE